MEERDERICVALWLAMVLCVVGAISMARFRSPALTAVFNATFWGSLVAYLASSTDMRRSIWWFLPLVLLYWITHRYFTISRDGRTVEAAVFGTDGQRFFALAKGWSLEARHAGWALFTFVRHPAQAMGRFLGLEEGGRVALQVLTAVVGALASWMVYVLARDQRAPHFPALLCAYLFGLSLAVWVEASVIDTYIVSVFFLLILLRELQAYFSGARAGPVPAGLVSGVLLGVSLENVYALLLFAGLFFLLRRTGDRPWRHLLIYAATTSAVCGAFLGCAASVSGADDQGLAGDVALASQYSSLSRLSSAKLHLLVGFNESVGSILAQHTRPVRGYSGNLPAGLGGATILYLALVGTLLVLAVPAIWSSDARRSPLFWTLPSILVLRHLFVVCFDPAESIIFSAPTIAVVALVLGYGASVQRGRRRASYGAALLALDLLLVVVNGFYFARVPESFPP